MLSAMAAKFKEIPLEDSELDVMYLIPQDKWPDGLEDKVEALLKQPTQE